jgi:CheY-like chemotaxis protein
VRAIKQLGEDWPVDKSVLVVDDDDGLLETLQELLETEGYDVTLAHNGIEALKTLETLTPAVILLDLRMPRMVGATFAHELQRRERLRSLYIIVLTANLYARRTADEMGANDFLAKPFDINELLEKVEQALRQAL